MSETLGIVVCRSASDFLKPGYVRDYACAICDEKVQVSPLGVDAIRMGAKPLCNPCGLDLQRKLTEKGVTQDVFISPDALQAIDEMMRARKGGNSK